MDLCILIASSGLEVSLEADDVADRIQVGGLRVAPGVGITKSPTQTTATMGIEIGRYGPLSGSQEA